MKIYTGVGSRETPLGILEEMKDLCYFLGIRGWTCSTGDAKGADQAFRETSIEYHFPLQVWSPNDHICERAIALALKHHPNPNALRAKPYALRLHARNGYQVLGKNLNEPTKFLLCWTKDGGETGGTGQAMRLARKYQIPIFNLYFRNYFIKLTELLDDY